MDYYKVLNVRADASDAELRRGFRDMALKYHPDKCTDVHAEATFSKICEAYDVLGSAKLRAIFDQFGCQALRHGIVEADGTFSEGYVFHGDARKVFIEFFGCDNPFAEHFADQGRPKNIFTKPLRQGETIIHELELSLEELYLGTMKKFKLDRKQMNADGHTSSVREVDVPITIRPGWKEGTKITFPEKGDEAPGTIPADVCFVVKQIPHPGFTRSGDDLIKKITLPLVDALTGCIVNVDALDGRMLNIAISDVAFPGYTKRVKGEGMPISKAPNTKGDLILEFQVSFPHALSENQKDLIKEALA